MYGLRLSCWFSHHHRSSAAGADDFTALIGSGVFESDNASIRFGAAGTPIDHFRSGTHSVPDKNRVRKCRSIESEVSEGGAEGRVGHGQTNDEAERENAVD